MIAASEPLEFIPRGRQAVEEHPGPQIEKQQFYIPSEHMLLHRMQNVNISADENTKEFWTVRGISERFQDSDRKLRGTAPQQNTPDCPTYITDFYVNSEEEIYVKGKTAVWTKGLTGNGNVLPRICFTCESKIRFAFFCHDDFVLPARDAKKKQENTEPDNFKEKLASVGLIDATSLRVYCNDGEDYLANLEFPVSNVWLTKYGILLEKEASNARIETHLISMPRFFSLSHPLDEMSPVLSKLSNGVISYLTESDYRILFSTNESDLVLLFDNKIGKHFIAKYRKTTPEEVEFVGCEQDNNSSTFINSNRPSFSFTQTPQKLSTLAKNSTAIMSSNMGKFLNPSPSPNRLFSPNLSFNRSIIQSPIERLHTSINITSMSVQNIRKTGQVQPSKPIVPEYCLEHIWMESLGGKDFCEVASTTFLHTDLVGQSYLCYLLARSEILYLVRLEKSNNSDKQIIGMISSIVARDAIVLKEMKMIAVLDPSGVLILYTGSVVVSKVNVRGRVLPNIPISSVHNSYSGSFPRRSSLLPTVIHQPETHFDDELHLLSPIHPLQCQFSNRHHQYVCIGIRDPAGNRLTLVYPNDKMFRITLPLLNDNHFVTKCIYALRQVLPKDMTMQLLVKWYGARNAPGSQDFSIKQEWESFKNVLSDLLGRSISSNEFPNSEMPNKRRRNDNDDDNCGTDDDWEYMYFVLNSKDEKNPYEDSINHNDSTAPLFSQIPVVFYALHLLYEDMKLDATLVCYLHFLAEFLYQLASDMQLHLYCFHYFLDFPYLKKLVVTKHYFTEEDAHKMHHKIILKRPAPNIFRQIHDVIRGKEFVKYPCVLNVNTMSRNVVQLTSLIIHGDTKLKNWILDIEFGGTPSAEFSKLPKRLISTKVSRNVQVIQMLINMDLTRKEVERLPPAIHIIVAQALEHCRLTPPIGCSSRAYKLLLRPELVAHTKAAKFTPDMHTNETKSCRKKETSVAPRIPTPPKLLTKSDSSTNEDDGMENIDTKLLSLRFPNDLRTDEVRRLLNSSEPVIIDITQSPGVSDHEFIEEQEKQLFALCTRTMTLPMGRGMFTLRTSKPTSTESLPIPKLCLTGKEPVKGASIEMQLIEFPPNMSLWPTFHNGVAAGLKISPHAKDIDSTWIVYNRPKNANDVPTEHAGFLMALGLNGHLRNLSFMSVYEYLVKCDEMTSIGLLLGISGTHRGTMDNTTTKLLSVHIEALLPATALELDIPQNIQIASLMGIGLLYQQTAKRHIAEVLLQEIGRPPGPEMENSLERESYALTAGLALGLVTLGQGESPAGLRDLQLPNTLHYYMVGGHRRPLAGSQKEKYKLSSFQVREGDTVNIDVTAPGATLALGLMFFKTGNKAVAQWMMPPDTSYLLDLIRPDLLLLRIISKGLIMWDDIRPDYEWLFGQFPSNLEFDLKHGPEMNGSDIDHEANAQAYCNIIAGAAFCIGLKYAGTEDPEAFKALCKTVKLILSWNGQYVGEFAGKATVESSLVLVVISLSLVFAGTGNLQAFRYIRYLRSRIGTAHSQVTYGSQMGIHMALGFLFLGAGRYTISRSPQAIAALVCALFPKFPNHSNDNRYHLQAFRHLYVLAVEPRLFLPRDIDTRKLCLCHITCLEIGSKEMREETMAPCLLPELNCLQSVTVNDPNYWPVCFERGRNWEQLENVLKNNGCIDVKKRAGCLSHMEDPHRLKSLLAQTLTSEQYRCWKIDIKSLQAFSSDARVMEFLDKFLETKETIDLSNPNCMLELEKTQLFGILFYNCLTKDKMHGLPIYLSLLNILQQLGTNSNASNVWQFKLIHAYQQINNDEILISKEILGAIIKKFYTLVEVWRIIYQDILRNFISVVNTDISCNLSAECLNKLIILITYFDIQPNSVNFIDLSSGRVNYLRLLCEYKKFNLDIETINCISKIINLK